MFLNADEERTLRGEHGWVLERAMRLLVALGELGHAQRLVPITRSQVAGVSYKTSGEPTLELLESLASEGVVSRTFATQNPAGMDLDRWKEMGVPHVFAEKQLRICAAYQKLGIKATCTCTPYLSGNRPQFGERVGFSESSAVSYVNSVIGARTNRHGGLDALSAALIGKVPLMGYLLDENRKADILVRVKAEMCSEADYGALGYYIGKNIGTDVVPCYEGLSDATPDKLKLLGAASAASGSTALFHVLDFTPEAKMIDPLYKQGKPCQVIDVGRKELSLTYEELSTSSNCDLVALGCPHCSLSELGRICNLLMGKRVRKDKRLWIFTSPDVYQNAVEVGYVRQIHASGADVFKHTCMVVMPIEDMEIRGVATNSAKAAFYIPRITHNRCKTELLSLEQCIKTALW